MPTRPATPPPPLDPLALPVPPQDRPTATCLDCPPGTAGTLWTTGWCDACQTCATHCGCRQPRGSMGGPYVNAPTLVFWGEPDPALPRHFGVEVECGLRSFRGPLPAFLRAWSGSCGTDCSVGDGRRLQRPPAGYEPVNPDMAVEVRTPPATGAVARDLIRGLGDALAAHGAHTDSTCGLHVHVDARGATADDLARLALVWSRVEGALWNAVAPSRRRNPQISRYCSSWGDAFDRQGVLAATTTIDKERAIRNARVNPNGQKYHALNFMPFWSQQTVEIRMHHGSVNARKILRWATCMVQIVHWAFTHTDAEARALRGTPSEIVDRLLDREHAAWMRRRREHFASMRSRTGQPPRRPARTVVPQEPVAPIPPDAGDGSEV